MRPLYLITATCSTGEMKYPVAVCSNKKSVDDIIKKLEDKGIAKFDPFDTSSDYSFYEVDVIDANEIIDSQIIWE